MKSGQRIHRTASQWQALIRQFEISGQSRTAFCRDRNIGYPSFCLWYNRLAGTATDKPAPAGELFTPLAFAPERLSPAPEASQPAHFCLTVTLGQWLTLKVNSGGGYLQ